MVITISKGIAIIILSAFICFFLAVTTDMNHQELGALVNFVWPPVIGLLSILLFVFISWITQNNTIRLIVLIFCCLYLIYVGVALHLGRDDLPLVDILITKPTEFRVSFSLSLCWSSVRLPSLRLVTDD
jgi:hypothetical protein